MFPRNNHIWPFSVILGMLWKWLLFSRQEWPNTQNTINKQFCEGVHAIAIMKICAIFKSVYCTLFTACVRDWTHLHRNSFSFFFRFFLFLLFFLLFVLSSHLVEFALRLVICLICVFEFTCVTEVMSCQVLNIWCCAQGKCKQERKMQIH